MLLLLLLLLLLFFFFLFFPPPPPPPPPPPSPSPYPGTSSVPLLFSCDITATEWNYLLKSVATDGKDRNSRLKLEKIGQVLRLCLEKLAKNLQFTLPAN